MKNPAKKIIVSIAITILLCCKGSVFFGQCISSIGTFTPGAVTNNTVSGNVVWAGMGNARVSDNIYVSSIYSVVGLATTKTSNYMNSTGYGFSVPPTATICGIIVDVDRKAGGLGFFTDVKDKNVYIIKGGVLMGANKASAASWPATNAIATYGSSSDAWGTTWTPADINSASFGVAIATEMSPGLSLLLSSDIDKINITVYYSTIVLPLETVAFTGVVEQHAVKLEWKTASEKNNDYFSVEKMNSNYEWDVLTEMKGAGNSTTLKHYQAYDQNPSDLNYYRVKQVDHDHHASYSEIISVEYALAQQNELTLYPQPATSVLFIQTKSKVEKAEIISNSGAIMIPSFQMSDHAGIDISSLPPGLYTLKIYTSRDVQLKRFIKE